MEAAWKDECETAKVRNLQAWHARMDDDTELLRWVRDTAEERPAVQGTPVHEQARLNRTADQWNAIWQQLPGSSHGRIRAMIFEEMKEEVDYVPMTARQLRRQFRRKRKKAMGTDELSPSLFADLPLEALEPLAEIVNTIAENYLRLPWQWNKVRVATTPKTDGSDRPLSIASAVWRAVAGAQIQAVRPWIHRWAPAELHGSIPGRDSRAIHVELGRCLAEVKRRHWHMLGCKLDLKKCFDHVDPRLAFACMEEMGLSPQIPSMLEGFYADLQRVFATKDRASPSWESATLGLLQGCPWSTILLAGVMAAYSCHVKTELRERLEDNGCVGLSV